MRAVIPIAVAVASIALAMLTAALVTNLGHGEALAPGAAQSNATPPVEGSPPAGENVAPASAGEQRQDAWVQAVPVHAAGTGVSDEPRVIETRNASTLALMVTPQGGVAVASTIVVEVWPASGGEPVMRVEGALPLAANATLPAGSWAVHARGGAGVGAAEQVAFTATWVD